MILEIGTLAATVVGYIIGGVKNSKGAEKASEEVSVAIWKWIRPIFLKKDEDLVEEIETNPDDKNMHTEIQNKIERLAKKDPEFAQELEQWLKKTPKGSELITEKIKGKQGVTMKAKMKNSNAKIVDIESEEGKVDFDIDLS